MHFQKMVMPAQMRSRLSSAKPLTAGTTVSSGITPAHSQIFLFIHSHFLFLKSICHMKESNSQEDFKIKVPLSFDGSKQ